MNHNNEVNVRITMCKDCNHSHEEKIYTADSFEHESGIYCGKCKDPDPYPGAQTKDRLIVSSDKDPREISYIPDWCPLLEREVIPKYPIEYKVQGYEELPIEYKRLLVKAVSKEGNVWVQGFFIVQKSGYYDHNRWVDINKVGVITLFGEAGFRFTEVYPETVCICSKITDTNNELVCEHDYLDPDHMNEVEFGNTGLNVNGDTPLDSFIGDKTPTVYGNRFDKVIYRNQKKERIDIP